MAMLGCSTLFLALVGALAIASWVIRFLIRLGSGNAPQTIEQGVAPYISTASADCEVQTIEYRTESGMNLFCFQAIRIAGTLRFYILQTMNYHAYGRADDGHSTHRYHDARGSYICWDGEEPSNWGEVQGLLKAWSEATEQYCFYGTRF